MHGLCLCISLHVRLDFEASVIETRTHAWVWNPWKPIRTYKFYLINLRNSISGSIFDITFEGFVRTSIYFWCGSRLQQLGLDKPTGSCLSGG